MNEKRVILVIEDEHTISNFICRALSANDYKAIPAFTGKEGLSLYFSHGPDLVLLDLGLPDMDGIEVLRELSGLPQETPVIIISARDRESEKVKALDMGADDYIVKPFRVRELLSRIRTVLRRAGKAAGSAGDALEYGNVQIFPAQGRVIKKGQDVFLTALEYRLLMTLVNNEGRVLSRSRLLESIWDVSGDFVNDNTLTVYIKRLREKIEDDPQDPRIIQTVRGMGYRIDALR